MPENSILNQSILNSIKHLLGITEQDTEFDQDIALLINSVFSNLVSMGVGPQTGYVITGSDNVWSEFCGADADANKIQNVKSYVYYKVKIAFDPPSNKAVLDSFESQAKEIEYRLYTEKGGY